MNAQTKISPMVFDFTRARMSAQEVANSCLVAYWMHCTGDVSCSPRRLDDARKALEELAECFGARLVYDAEGKANA